MKDQSRHVASTHALISDGKQGTILMFKNPKENINKLYISNAVVGGIRKQATKTKRNPSREYRGVNGGVGGGYSIFTAL